MEPDRQAANEYEQRRKLQNRAAQRRYRDRMKQCNTIQLVDFRSFTPDALALALTRDPREPTPSQQDFSPSIPIPNPSSTSLTAAPTAWAGELASSSYPRSESMDNATSYLDQSPWNMTESAASARTHTLQQQQQQQQHGTNQVYFPHSLDLADSTSTSTSTMNHHNHNPHSRAHTHDRARLGSSDMSGSHGAPTRTLTIAPTQTQRQSQNQNQGRNQPLSNMQLHHPEDLTDDGLQCSNASSNEFIYNPDMQPYGLLDWQRSRSPPRAHRASFTSGVSLREIASSSSSSSEHQGLVLSSAFPVREPDKHDFVEKQPPPSQSQSQSQSGQTIDVAFRQKVEDMVQELLRFYHVGLSLKLLQEDRELHSKLSALQRHFAMVKIHPPQGRIENSLPSPNSSVFSEGTTGNGNAIASVSKAATFSVTGEDY